MINSKKNFGCATYLIAVHTLLIRVCNLFKGIDNKTIRREDIEPISISTFIYFDFIAGSGRKEESRLI